MNQEKNYSPISIIDSEQMIRIKDIRSTDFSFAMYTHFEYDSFEKHYYLENDSDREAKREFVLLRSNPCQYADKRESVCLCSKVVRNDEVSRNWYDYGERYIGQPFGIVPTILYKYVSNMVQETAQKDIFYLGHYPKRKISFPSKLYDGDEGVDSSEQQFEITEEKFSFPKVVNRQLVLENCNVYRVTTSKKTEIKAIKYNDEWFEIQPVVWKKIGESLICNSILLESPVHIEDKNIQLFDDTFLKWYMDNIFIRDLFQYTNCTFMKKQMLLGIDENIHAKTQEIERLKQMKENFLLQQKEEENLLDIAHRNITRLFAENDENKTEMNIKCR